MEKDGTKLETFLANIKVNDRPYFTVVDRNTLNVILKEQKMVFWGKLFALEIANMRPLL